MSKSIFAQRARSPEATHNIVRLTPELAEKWLSKNKHNRNIRRQKVTEFVRDMEAGRWVFNGDAIRFSESGALLDGQHRCLAVVESGVTISVLVVWNLPDAAQDTMDVGARRTMSDQLNLAGEKHATSLAAVLRKVASWDHGDGWSRNYTPTFSEMRLYYDEHPEIDYAVEIALKARVLPCAPSTIAALYHVCASKDRAAAELFFGEQLIAGIGLSRTDPAYALRVKLRAGEVRERDGDGETRRRFREDDIIRYVLLAWNLFREGRRVQKLQAPKGGWNGKFPEPK